MSATEATIRPANRGDLAALADLARRTWTDAFGASLDADDLAIELETRRSADYFAEAIDRTTILVAEHAGQLLGYVQFGPLEIPEVAAGAGDRQLHRIYVDRSAQRKGLGRRLMSAALAHPELAAAERVYLGVWEENEGAVRLYESIGFRPVGMTSYEIGDKKVGDDVVMCLEVRRRG